MSPKRQRSATNTRYRHRPVLPMSRRIKCEYCDRAPVFQNVDRELVCDLHNAAVTEAKPREQPCGLKSTRVSRSGAWEALLLEARAAVGDMAFVRHEDTRVHD